MKFVTIALIPTLLLGACSRTVSNAGLVLDHLIVPSVVEYTPAQQDAAAKEMAACDKTPVMCLMLNDYGTMRDEARAALGQAVDFTR